MTKKIITDWLLRISHFKTKISLIIIVFENIFIWDSKRILIVRCINLRLYSVNILIDLIRCVDEIRWYIRLIILLTWITIIFCLILIRLIIWGRIDTIVLLNWLIIILFFLILEVIRRAHQRDSWIIICIITGLLLFNLLSIHFLKSIIYIFI